MHIAIDAQFTRIHTVSSIYQLHNYSYMQPNPPGGVHPGVHPIREVRSKGGVLKDVAVRLSPPIRSLEGVKTKSRHQAIVVLRVAETIGGNQPTGAECGNVQSPTDGQKARCQDGGDSAG